MTINEPRWVTGAGCGPAARSPPEHGGLGALQPPVPMGPGGGDRSGTRTRSTASSPALPHAPLGEISDSPNAGSQCRAVAPWLAPAPQPPRGLATTGPFWWPSGVWGKERALGGLKRGSQLMGAEGEGAGVQTDGHTALRWVGEESLRPQEELYSSGAGAGGSAKANSHKKSPRKIKQPGPVRCLWRP